MNPGIDHKGTGCLVLLLALLVLHFVKPAFIPSRPSVSSDEGHLFIQVGGDVKCPGVYTFNHLPHLTHLIARAGGLRSDRILPENFEDLAFSSGMKVTVHLGGEDPPPHQSEAPRAKARGNLLRQSGRLGYEGQVQATVSEMSAFYKTTLGIPISLNGESETGLTAIPGIGLGLARTIVEERSRRGGFRSLDELLSIHGIGEKLYRKIRPYLTLQEGKKGM